MLIFNTMRFGTDDFYFDTSDGKTKSRLVLGITFGDGTSKKQQLRNPKVDLVKADILAVDGSIIVSPKTNSQFKEWSSAKSPQGKIF